jgi:hypothetical protein
MERLEQPWKTVNHYLSAYGRLPLLWNGKRAGLICDEILFADRLE